MARRRRLTPLSSFQRRDDPIRLLAEKGEPHVAKLMKDALKRLSDIVPVQEIARAIQHGQGSKAADLINWKLALRVLVKPVAQLARIYEVAAHHGGQQIDGHLRTKKRSPTKIEARLRRLANRRSGLSYTPPHLRKDVKRPPVQAIIDDILQSADDAEFSFDRFDPNTQRRLRGLIDDLIEDLSSKARKTISSTVVSGLRAGDSAEEIARNIRDTITLNPTQAEHVASYRRGLEDLDPNVLRRALRNSDHDDAIQDAIDSGEFLSDSVISDAVDAYLENYLDHRADTIARTESLRAANAGLLEGYKQADETGAIPSAAVRRHWRIELDEATCPICLSIVENNPDGVGLDESFQSDDGPVEDPPVHPRCRCTVEYITDLDQLPDPEEDQ